MKNHEYQFVTAVHGNEQMPTLALTTMGEKQVIGNPLALSRTIRYVETDLNAAFGLEGVLYEQKRSVEVLRQLSEKQLVIDFHTFSQPSPSFAIVVDLSMVPLAASLGVEYVVHMKHNIKKGHALINYRSGVSVEVGTHQASDSFDLAQAIVERVHRDGIHPKPIRLLEVFDRIFEPGQFKCNKRLLIS